MNACVQVPLPILQGRIRELLPHRYPMLLIDRVTALDVGKSATGYKNVSINEDFFNGHFVETPIMPGVLIIEAMAQMAGILGLATAEMTSRTRKVYLFVGADCVRFRRQVIPGDRLDITAIFTSKKHSFYKFLCTAMVDGEVAARAEILVTEQSL